MLTIPEALTRAVAAYTKGQFVEAEQLCHRVVNANPNCFDGLRLLAYAQTHLGRGSDALASYDRALALRPNDVVLVNNRGAILQALKRFDEALGSYDQAIALKPDYTDAFYNRGVILQQLQRYEEALASYDQALAVQPRHTTALNNRGSALRELKRFEDALASYERVLAILPNDVAALNNRGVVLHELKRFEHALASYDQALALQPNYVEALTNRVVTLHELRRFEDALASCERALMVRPAHPAAVIHLGLTLYYLGRFEEALACYEQALAIAPELALAHWHEALLRLLLGDFERGWRKYEWRWRLGKLAPLKRDFAQPLWLGEEEIAGKTILLHADQGFGDTIQACRYAGLAAQRGARVIVEVQASLKALMLELVGPVQVLARGEPMPAFDVHCPLMSLPLAFGTRLETIPADVPYLRAPPDRLERWTARLPRSGSLRVGLVWTGKPSNPTNSVRSIPFERLEPILSLPGFQFVSLQKDIPAADAERVQSHTDLINLGPELHDFADTAAVIAQLDLIISVETATAHLAGAMGKPLYIPLADPPDWRWLLGREDSPWYPTARLFRQQEPGNWADVIRRLAGAVAAFRPGGEATSLR